MTWRNTLRLAATISPEAERELPRIEQVLSDALSGTSNAGQVEQILGMAGVRREGYIEALGAALSPENASGPAGNAVRAVLYRLPYVLDEIRVDPDVSSWKSSARTRLKQALEAIEVHERELAKGAPHTYSSLRCPRCGWTHVSTRHTDEFARRFMEAKCEACGAYASWFEGDAEADRWNRASGDARTSDVSGEPID